MKKTAKPIKSKLVSKKVKLDKSSKKSKTTPASKGAAKSVKKLVAKVVKKAEKKVVKPIKPARTSGGKAVAKKIAPKKEVKKANKKVVKPAKQVKKVEPKKALKAVTKEKKVIIVKKPSTVKPEVNSKTLAKVDKKAKPEKEEKVKKVAIPKEPKVKAPKKSKGGRKPKNKDDDDEPIIEEDILIEQLINSTKRLKKPVKIPKQLRTFTNPMASLTVASIGGTGKLAKSLPKKEPKGKFELEYVIRTSAGILYEFLTSPSGLSEWFADDVNIHDGIFTFFWEGSEQKARLLAFKEEKFVRLQWLDKPEGTYFEFRIERDELTGDTSLMIVDFADEASDMETSKRLWDSQINALLNVIGSY